MMVFSSLFLIIYFFLLFFVELPFLVVFPDLSLPKVGPQDVRFFDCNAPINVKPAGWGAGHWVGI